MVRDRSHGVHGVNCKFAGAYSCLAHSTPLLIRQRQGAGFVTLMASKEWQMHYAFVLDDRIIPINKMAQSMRNMALRANTLRAGDTPRAGD